VVLPLALPVGKEAGLRGIVDPVRRVMNRFVPEDRGKTVVEERVPPEMSDAVEAARARIVEIAAEHGDDAATQKFLEGGDLSEGEIAAGIRRGTLARAVIPVLCGSALKDIGIQPLLDAVVAYLPSPVEAGEILGHDPEDPEKRILRKPDPKGPLAALVFKTFSEKHGDLIYLRVYSGTLRRNDQVWNPGKGKVERVGQLLRMHANHRESAEEARPGDIVATMGLRFTVTGDTLCTKKDPVLLESMRFPETVMSLAIEPRSGADRDNLAEALGRLAKDDPTFTARTDDETGQTVISGMGELHLEVLVNRLTRDFGVSAHVGKPRVAYRQTVGGTARGEAVFERMVGEKRQYARVKLEVFPGDGKDHLAMGLATLPPVYRNAVRAGVRSSEQGGCGLGYPTVNVGCRLLESTVHPQDSTEAAFEAAASQAFGEAFDAAGAVLLEPVMSVVVHTPEEFLGNVLGDLQRRRAVIENIENPGPGIRVIRGEVALAEMFGYSTSLRSVSQGRAGFSMEPRSYGPVPPERARGMIL